MYKFKRMVQGCSKGYAKHSKDPQPAKDLRHAVEACQSFVFSPPKQEVLLGKPLHPDEIAWPFPVCSFEASGAECALAGSSASGEYVGVNCLLVDTLSRSIWMEQVTVNQGKVTRRDVACCPFEAPEATDFMKIAVAMLERLEQEVAWEQGTGNAQITLRKGGRARGNKRVTVIKKHVIVVGKKPGARAGRDGESHEPIEIEWTHRWSVRGHWRSVSGFGKDSRGNYNQVGRTWVMPHEKGPTGLPYVKKVRLVAA